MTNSRTWYHGLCAKFLVVVIPLFLVLSIPSTFLIVEYEASLDEDGLAARIGGQTARVARFINDHGGIENPRSAQEMLAFLAHDPAFLCAELRVAGLAGARAKIPTDVGCIGQSDSNHLTIPVNDAGTVSLLVQFSDAEIVNAAAERRALTQLVLVSSFIVSVLAALVAFRLIVDRPLKKLLSAIRASSDYGIRTPIGYRSKDEIGTITSAFDEMLEREGSREQALEEAHAALLNSEKELRNLNRDLED
ncbi:MAG: HAMP domain-containing protein, partial [Kiloniellales bacterium]|nr:HAMP domain-containing protein [Kiloniellales bacterium]